MDSQTVNIEKNTPLMKGTCVFKSVQRKEIEDIQLRRLQVRELKMNM